MVGTDGAVIGARFDRMLHHLDVAPRFEAPPTLPEEVVPVGDATEQLADMDEVELVAGVGPGEGDVVDLEDAVRRNKSGLDGREVDTGNFSARILVGHVAGDWVNNRDQIVREIRRLTWPKSPFPCPRRGFPAVVCLDELQPTGDGGRMIPGARKSARGEAFRLR